MPALIWKTFAKFLLFSVFFERVRHNCIFLGQLSPHLLLSLLPLMVRPVGARGLCNCVTAFRESSSAAGLSCTGLKCHAYYEFNTAKRSFIHVCLLIALFSILVFGCLESDDRSYRRLHCGIALL